MSMLAEKKRKQKWSLNPQGKHWVSDSNKFGLKILESLGWKEGKGLGKQQHGITEPIKISYKNDSKGLGLKETQSSLQQEHFNNLLATLNNSTPNSSPMQVGSLEEKSQNSRSRVHYKKFTRGKDISRYSQKDLASIFEKKTENGETADSKIINKGSMSGYFKNRVPQLDKSDDEEASPGFGFKNPAFEPMGQSFTMVKHKLEPIVETENEKDTSAVVDDDKCEPNEFEVKRKSKKSKRGDSEKKKKPKKTKNDCITDGGIDNPVLHVDAISTDVTHGKKKTKKKKKNSMPQVDDALPSAIVDGGGGKRKQNEDQAQVDLNCKVKKRKKYVALENKAVGDGIDNPTFNPVSVPDIECDLILNVVEEPVAETKLSKSNKKMKNVGLDNYGFDAKTQRIDESMATLSNTIETYQAEVENDMNECKDARSIEEYMVVGVSNDRDGENERVEGGVVLRYKYATFGKDPHWAARNNQSVSFARKSYKHLIQGDIVVGFNESNLHEIKGYGNRM